MSFAGPIIQAITDKNDNIISCYGLLLQTKAAYKQHLQSHFSEDRWGCPVCGKGFKSKGVLDDHKRSIHRDTYGVNLK